MRPGGENCCSIISNSFHGLIIPDSYCIPNRHVVLTNKLSGDGYKFRDYYSPFGLDDVIIDINRNSTVDIDSIIGDYRITKNMVEKKQGKNTAAF